jgi:LysM repeat protein
VPRRSWTHYAAPAAFLLAVTILVLLIRSAINDEPAGVTSAASPTVPRRTVPATTQKKKPKPAKRPTSVRFYTVVAGDTFGVIATKTGTSVARIEQLNPNVESTALYIGQRIRIR